MRENFSNHRNTMELREKIQLWDEMRTRLMWECADQVILPRQLRCQSVPVIKGISQIEFLDRSNFCIIDLNYSAFCFSFSIIITIEDIL